MTTTTAPTDTVTVAALRAAADMIEETAGHIADAVETMSVEINSGNYVSDDYYPVTINLGQFGEHETEISVEMDAGGHSVEAEVDVAEAMGNAPYNTREMSEKVEELRDLANTWENAPAIANIAEPRTAHEAMGAAALAATAAILANGDADDARRLLAVAAGMTDEAVAIQSGKGHYVEVEEADGGEAYDTSARAEFDAPGAITL